ncbi:hypothetical protein ACJMK2_039158, partial [Sinanodonta woodiana]
SFTEKEKCLLPSSNDQEWRREKRLAKTEAKRPTTHLLANDHSGTEKKILDTKTDDVQQADKRHLKQKLETSSKTR